MNLETYADIFINLTNFHTKEINYRRSNPYFKYEKIFSYYTLFLIVIGTLCNLLSFIVMNRKQIRKYACMKYLSALAISDMMILYQWNLNTFFKYNLSKPPFYLDLEEISLISCRLIAFFAFFCLQLSAWLLSIVSFDRLMLVYSTKWKHIMHKPKRVCMLITATVLTIFSLNFHLLFLNGYVIKNDLSYASQIVTKLQETKSVLSGHVHISKYANISKFVYIPKEEIICYKNINDQDYIFPKWEKAHLILYTILPFAIMLISNSLIIYNVLYGQKVESKVKASLRRKRRMTYMLIIITFAFIILTLPSVIVHTFFRDYLKKKPYRRFVNLIVNNLLHTSHAINFFMYVFSAPNFRLELISICNNLFHRNGNFKYNNNNNNSRRGTMLSGFIKNQVTKNNNKMNETMDESSFKQEKNLLMPLQDGKFKIVCSESNSTTPNMEKKTKQLKFNV